MPSNALVSYSVSSQKLNFAIDYCYYKHFYFVFPLATIRFPLRTFGCPVPLCRTEKVLNNGNFYPPGLIRGSPTCKVSLIHRKPRMAAEPQELIFSCLFICVMNNVFLFKQKTSQSLFGLICPEGRKLQKFDFGIAYYVSYYRS